jgi:hypothetical protein
VELTQTFPTSGALGSNVISSDLQNIPLESHLEFTKCFVVSPSGVRAINTPAGLTAAIAKTSISPADYPTVVSELSVPFPPGQNYRESGPGLSQLGETLPDGDVLYFSTGPLPLTPFYVRQFDDPGASSMNDFLDAVPLLSCYGIGFLNSERHNKYTIQQMFSPAIYTFLSDIDSSLLSDYDAYYAPGGGFSVNILYATAAKQLPATPAAPYFLCPTPWAGGGYIIGPFVKATSTPTAADVAMTYPDEFEPADEFLAFSGSLSGFNVTWAWDWRHPLYCRSKLLALGFTDADLTP